MHTKVKALTSFVHGRIVLTPGQEGEFTKGDAEELQKSGLVDILGEHDDLLGGDAKAAAPLENKMADAPANKRKAKE